MWCDNDIIVIDFNLPQSWTLSLPCPLNYFHRSQADKYQVMNMSKEPVEMIPSIKVVFQHSNWNLYNQHTHFNRCINLSGCQPILSCFYECVQHSRSLVVFGHLVQVLKKFCQCWIWRSAIIRVEIISGGGWDELYLRASARIWCCWKKFVVLYNKLVTIWKTF